MSDPIYILKLVDGSEIITRAQFNQSADDFESVVISKPKKIMVTGVNPEGFPVIAFVPFFISVPDATDINLDPSTIMASVEECYIPKEFVNEYIAKSSGIKLI